MTLEELWKLFPISLSPYNRQWICWAKEEIRLLSDMLVGFHPIISHIGSTAIENIHAKPIIDILVELSNDTDYALIKDIMESNGYICMSQADGRINFNKGYTPAGYAERVFHIHFHRYGDNDEIHFRDYLISHPEAAKEYDRLKQSLLSKYKNNRDRYTEAKTEFVRKIVSLARGY